MTARAARAIVNARLARAAEKRERKMAYRILLALRDRGSR